jgi:hypothetical protein
MTYRVDFTAFRGLDVTEAFCTPIIVGRELRGRGNHAGDILIPSAAAEPMSGKV